MANESHSVQFAGGNLGGQRHICAFFNSTDEEHRVLHSFIKDGLTGEIKPSISLTRATGRTSQAARRSTVSMCKTRNGHRPIGGAAVAKRLPARGPFDQNAMLALIEEVLQSAERRVPAHQTGAHMEWALLGDNPASITLVESRHGSTTCFPSTNDR